MVFGVRSRHTDVTMDNKTKILSKMIKTGFGEKKAQLKRKRDNYVERWRRDAVLNYLRGELRTSTTHGVPYIVNTELHWTERLFWTVSFLICCVIVVMLLRSQYKRFIEAPIVASVEMDYFEWNISYPAITFCPYDKPDSQTWSDLLNETASSMETRLGVREELYLWAIVSSGMDSLHTFALDDTNTSYKIDPKDYAALAAKTFREIPSSSINTNNNKPLVLESVMTELGMCHVLNSNVAHYDDPLKWHNNAPYVAKNMLLSIHDRDFFTQIVNYGFIFKVFIHSPDETIISTSPSYIQSENGLLTFGLQVYTSRISHALRRFPRRIRRCRLLNEPISKRYPIYSYNHCMLECRIRMIKKICGCLPHYYRPLPNEKICKLSELKCILKHKKAFNAFAATQEMLKQFPHVKNLPMSHRDCGCITSCENVKYLKDYESFIRESDFSRVRIGLSAFPKMRVVRDIIFDVYDAILKSGGVINLCIGSSIISLFECICTCVRLFLFVHMRKK